ncbi:MAG: signal peptidase II [Bdellovibrionales bacterium]|nr:signal peptidase II [Oligoflexia bacterium]
MGIFVVKALFFFLSIFLVIVIDQWTKLSVLSHFEYGESLPVIQNFFSITYVRNTGAAFGFLASANPGFRVPFFLIVPLIAMVVLGFLYRDLPKDARYRSMALGLVSGGAFGNLIDRVRLGYVVDFLDCHWKTDYYFPAFNVADSAICVGVAILLLSTFKQTRDLTHVSTPVRN